MLSWRRLRWFPLLLIALTACAPRVAERTLHEPEEFTTLDGGAPFLKAHLPDGGLYILGDWLIDESRREVLGVGVLYDARRDTVAAQDFVVSVDDVALFESNVLTMSPAVGPLVVMTGVTVGLTIYCISNPKACFGSCPTYYADVDGEPVLQAEGFSASVAPALERDDIDALFRTRPRGERFELTVTNEALETHVIRYSDLLVAPCSEDGRVLADMDGRFREATRILPIKRATGPEGDCTDWLRDLDGDERCSAADSSDLAAREYLELEFEPGARRSAGLLVASRQSLLTTYLFYQGLAYLGDRAVPALARADSGSYFDPEAGTVGNALGAIEVQVPTGGGGWRTVGSVGETGPLAVNLHLLPLPAEAADSDRLRLRLTRGHWRLDWVALAELGDEVVPRRLHPETVLRDGSEDPDALAALLDPARTVVTLPGDRLTLVYALPPEIARPEVFVHCRGYYLEWIRREWLAEADPLNAALLLKAPDLALRALAPDFKAVEPEMEDLFWGSRYAP